MGNKFETEKGDVYVYSGASQQEHPCACGGNCACKNEGSQDACACGGECGCK